MDTCPYEHKPSNYLRSCRSGQSRRRQCSGLRTQAFGSPRAQAATSSASRSCGGRVCVRACVQWASYYVSSEPHHTRAITSTTSSVGSKTKAKKDHSARFVSGRFTARSLPYTHTGAREGKNIRTRRNGKKRKNVPRLTVVEFEALIDRSPKQASMRARHPQPYPALALRHPLRDALLQT